MWSEIALAEALEVVIDHRGKTPKKLGAEDFTDSGVPVVSAIHIKGGRIEWGERERYVPQWLFEKWMSARLRKGDVLLTSEAPLGEVAQVSSNDDLVLSQRLFALRGKNDLLDSSFLRYFLESPVGQSRLKARSSGTTVVGIRQAELLKVLVPVPPLEEQRRIAGVLRALDVLVEHNRRLINDTLTLARTVFEAQDIEGLPTTFGEIADVFGGGTPPTKEPSYWNGDVYWATPTDITRLSSPYLFSTARTITSGGLAVCSSSLYPAGSILMTSRATIGAFALAQVPTAVNQGFIVVVPRSDAERTFLLLEMMSRVPEFIKQANGTTFLELSRGKFKALPITWPTDDVLAGLHRELGPLLAAGASLQEEVDDLIRTRNELLPLLMSGRVTVRGAEGLVA